MWKLCAFADMDSDNAPQCRRFAILFLWRGIIMRLRRLELAVLAITLAFAFFIGGFFTGRSWSAVNITAVATQSENEASLGVSIQAPAQPQPAAPTQNESIILENESAQPPPADPAPVETSDAAGAPSGGDGKININIASQSELMDLPGIGNVLASRIVDYRRQHGDFLRIEDIRNVSGIGEKRYEAIENHITVG